MGVGIDHKKHKRWWTGHLRVLFFLRLSLARLEVEAPTNDWGRQIDPGLEHRSIFKIQISVPFRDLSQEVGTPFDRSTPRDRFHSRQYLTGT